MVEQPDRLTTLTLYDVLGVEAHVDRAELKRAYRALAKRLHPDTAADGGDVARFRRVTEAYNLLSNRERRRAYDLQLANARAQARRVGGLGRPHRNE